jgi:hypothetical protein
MYENFVQWNPKFRQSLLPTVPRVIIGKDICSSAAEGGGGGRKPEQTTGSQRRCICFCLSWYYYLPIVQINPFRSSSSHFATES